MLQIDAQSRVAYRGANTFLTGEARIENDQICMRFDGYYKGRWLCGDVFRDTAGNTGAAKATSMCCPTGCGISRSSPVSRRPPGSRLGRGRAACCCRSLSCILAEAALRADAEAVADNQHPDHQLRIDRRAPHGAVERRQLPPHPRQIHKAVDRPQEMIARHMGIEREVVKQRTLFDLSVPSSTQSPPLVRLNQ